MSGSLKRMYELVEDLQRLADEGFPIFPTRTVVKTKDLQRIADDFPNAIDEEIVEARAILRRKEDIIQDAQMKAERIIATAENERHRILSESSILKEIEEKAQIFKQEVMEECENIKMKAFNEAEGVRLDASQEAIKIKEGAQEYAEQILAKLEGDLNQLYQIVMNGQQYLSQTKEPKDVKPSSPMLDLDKK